MPRSSEPKLPALRRVLAAGSAALVLALAVFAVSPNAHAWVHDDDGCGHGEQQEHSCAIVLFAGGVALPLEFGPVRAPAGELAAAFAPSPAELLLSPPRYLRQPERGPPHC